MSANLAAQVQRIAADVFGLPLQRVTPQMSPRDIDNWDSIHHVNLVMALEQELGVEFEPEEIEQMESLDSIVRIVENKLGSG